MNKETSTSVYRRKPFQELTFTDDFMFRQVLTGDPDLCRRLIELLLDVEIDHIVYKDDDRSLGFNSDAKGVRVDVYLRDDEGSVFDLEMQNKDEKDLPKRSRYYQGLIDRDNLLSGKDYEELPNSYIVFICKFDPFGKDLHKYEFRELCVEDPGVELGDGAAKVFINAKGRRENASAEMQAFLDYLCGQKASSEITRDIDTGVAKVKKSGTIEEEYMYVARPLRDAYKEGREEGKFESVDKLVADGSYTAEKACEILGVDYSKYCNRENTASVK